MITIDNLSKTIADFQLKNISLKINKGEYFVILGKSGAGKTVLLELISGLLSVDKGKIFLNNRDITNEKIQNRNIGLVYQDQCLFPHLSVKENISYSLKCKKINKKEINDKIESLADRLGIKSLLNRNPGFLSIGESQRVAIARAIATEPECLLLDEPLASLDNQAKSVIRSLLREINRSGQTIIHITHDYLEAIALADRIAIIEDNKITQIGTCDEIFRHPKTEFVAKFIGIKNFYKGKLGSLKTGTSIFDTGKIKFYLNTDKTGGNGYLILRSEDIVISNIQQQSSALNTFQGTIIDIERVAQGVEITVDIGVTISSLITNESLNKLKLNLNKKVFITFKASAAQFIRE